MESTLKVLASDISLGTKLCSTVMYVLCWTVSFPFPRPLPEAVQLAMVLAMQSAGGLCSTLQYDLLRSSLKFLHSKFRYGSVAPLLYIGVVSGTDKNRQSPRLQPRRQREGLDHTATGSTAISHHARFSVAWCPLP